MGLLEIMMEVNIFLSFGPEKYDAIFDRIRYVIRLGSGITYVASHNYAKIKVD